VCFDQVQMLLGVNHAAFRADCLPDCAGFKDADVIGSPELVQTLIEHELIDEFRLMIDPLLVGRRKADLPGRRGLTSMELVESDITTTGATLATYAVTHS
jgi:dihydrofolate reductase